MTTEKNFKRSETNCAVKWRTLEYRLICMNEPTKKQKVKALMQSMGLTFKKACELLGYNEHDPELINTSSVDYLFDILGMKK